MMIRSVTYCSCSMLVLGLLAAAQPATAQVKPELDPKIVAYQPVNHLAGKLTIAGSETMKPLTEAWAEDLRRLYPHLALNVDSTGSEAGLSQLFEGKAKIAAMSRRMTTQEINEFMREFGYEPTEVPVAVDALAVYVHKDNPIVGLTLAELDAIFSRERRRGLKYPIEKWGHVILEDEWAEAPIRLYGRNGKSGTATFFREHVSNGAALNSSMVSEAGSASVVMDVGHDRYGIGFSGIGYRTSSVRPVPLAAVPGGKYVEPTFQTAIDGSYPLRRNLYLYVNRPPKSAPSPETAEFVKYAVSRQGQQQVISHGYYPLPTSDIARLVSLWSGPVKAASVEGPPQFRD